jgi:hypothetical protein
MSRTIGKSKDMIMEKIDEGYILVRAIIEMLGKPKEHVLATLKSYVKKLTESDKFVLVKEEYSQPEEKETMFSVFAEVELLIKGTEEVTWFCFDYMPSSIEVLEPAELKYESSHFTNFLNDLIGRLHQLDMALKTDEAKISKINSNSESLLKNFFAYVLEDGPRKIAEISQILGLSEEDSLTLLNRFVGERFITKTDEYYSLSDSVETIYKERKEARKK